jgi:tetratricopeptide (TPR) repeat protein
MKIRLAILLALAALPAISQFSSAQTIVSQGMGLAHDCFILAKTGNDPRTGVETCDLALRQEILNVRDKAATHDNRGVMLDKLGRIEAAVEDFNASIRLDPTLGDPYVNMGSMLIKQHRLDEALAHINKGLDLGMSFPAVGYYDRAVAEQLMGRFKEAYYDYKKALELEPHFEQASERLKDFTVIRTPQPG